VLGQNVHLRVEMKNQKFTYKQYQTLRELPLMQKIERAEQLIVRELKDAEKPAVACSFGKDSMVLLHLVRVFCKRAIVVFHNTGVQYSETYKYRDRILKEWNIENYHESKPIMSFWKCVEKYGYPQFRQMGKGKSHKEQGKHRVPRCCYYLKEKPAKDFIKQAKIDLEFVGLQASESMVRRLSFFREGEAFNSKSYGCRIVRPLMIWTDKDVWQYHEIFGIPLNPVYLKMKRNGCMPCTGFKGWRKQLARTNPKVYAFISKQMGQPLLTEYNKVPCDVT